MTADGHAMTPEAKAFELYCAREGLAKEDLWGVFTTPRDGKSYQIVGYNAHAPKMPLLCKSTEDGKIYKFRTGAFSRSKGFGTALERIVFENIPNEILNPEVDRLKAEAERFSPASRGVAAKEFAEFPNPFTEEDKQGKSTGEGECV